MTRKHPAFPDPLRHPPRPGVEWPTVAVAVIAYAGWAAAGLWLWPVHRAAGLAVMTVLAALHASLVHEVSHGHPTRYAWVNEALVFWPLALVWPFRRFRALHLAHHRDARITDPETDPESAYATPGRYAALPAPARALLVANNTMVGRMVLGPLLAAVGLVVGDARRIAAGEGGIALAWVLHATGVAGVLVVVVGVFGIPLWLYAATAAWGALGVVCIRSFAEHRWRDRPEERSIIVERSPLALLFLNNNLHLVHHTHPGVPWYALPALYRANRDTWCVANAGYVVPGYWALLRAHAFRTKEPVVHPALASGSRGPVRLRGERHDVEGARGRAGAMNPIAAFPMYDWPAVSAEVDAAWARCRDGLRDAGIEAPPRLARRNSDLPPVRGGIRDPRGKVIAPDPATLPPDAFDVAVLWRHPALLVAQTCWGPLEAGLAAHARVIGQPDYSPFEGGEGPLYRSALLMRGRGDVAPPLDGTASLPVEAMRGRRFAYNGPVSMSGVLALQRDLVAAGVLGAAEEFERWWSGTLVTGEHRRSLVALAGNRADVAAVDCRSLALARRHEPAMEALHVVGWTAPRPGLPLITNGAQPDPIVRCLREALRAQGAIVAPAAVDDVG